MTPPPYEQVNRNYQILQSVSSEHDVAFVSEVSNWFYSFVTYIETEEEATDSMAKLKDVIMASVGGNIKESLVVNTFEYVEDKFEDQLVRMGNWKYMTKWSGWVGENCFTESSNASLSKCPFGPKPKMHLHQSTDCIMQHTEETYRKRTTEAFKGLHARKQKPKRKSDDTVEKAAQRLLSSDIIEVKNDSAFNEYALASNYKCAEVLSHDNVILPPPTNARKFVVKYGKGPPIMPSHRRPIYLQTRTVTVEEVVIDNHYFLCLKCSCSFLRYRKHACRHIYQVVQRLPSKQDFLPDCYKTYEIAYGSDTVYTQSVNGLRYYLEACGGLLYEGLLSEFCTNNKFEDDLEFFKSSYGTSIDTNPRSSDTNVAKGQRDKATVFRSATATKRGGSNSHYVTLHPLFAQVAEQIKDHEGHDLLSKLLYEGLKGVIEINNRSKKTTTDKGETALVKVVPVQPTLFHVSTDHKVGVVVTTGAVDTKKEHKRAAPGGSPSSFKR